MEGDKVVVTSAILRCDMLRWGCPKCFEDQPWVVAGLKGPVVLYMCLFCEELFLAVDDSFIEVDSKVRLIPEKGECAGITYQGVVERHPWCSSTLLSVNTA